LSARNEGKKREKKFIFFVSFFFVFSLSFAMKNVRFPKKNL